ncbi:twin-arginine translocation signal domain-containing protein, partial [Lutimonas sp.]|uniref:twin-arginine translocation signal domain-containing protein n=1 Tax=Lutimonas sp. TaxID=1872403 RepID=UPI003D9B5652
MTSRRNFIKSTGTALGSAALLSQVPFVLSGFKNTPKSIGFQVWTLREQLFQDFPGTLKKMANLGYSEVEMCSPLGYKGTFDRFAKYSGTELKKIIEDQGLQCSSSHYNLNELRDDFGKTIEWTHQMGIRQMPLAAFW